MFSYVGSPISIPAGGSVYDPYAAYTYAGATANDSPFAPSPISQANYRRDLAANSPFAQESQMNQLQMQLLQSLLGGGGGGGGLFDFIGGGAGGGGGGGDGSILNLFDLARERAHQGLFDQFTMAGGGSSLLGPFTTASANLERGLGLTEQGSLVDLQSRMNSPLLQLILGLLTRG